MSVINSCLDANIRRFLRSHLCSEVSSRSARVLVPFLLCKENEAKKLICKPVPHFCSIPRQRRPCNCK